MPVITRTSATPAPLERPAASRRLVSFLTSRTGVRHKIDGKWLLAAAFVALSGSGSLLATPTAEVQPEWQATSDIEETAAAYIRSRMPATGGDTSVAANRLDPRLRLARCDRALEAFVRPGTRVQSRTTVGVRCTGSKPWKVYVPVDLVIQAAVLTPRRVIRRGEIITAGDLVADIRDVSRLNNGFFTDPAELVGQKVRLQLNAGMVITQNSVEADSVIRRGQTVTLVVRTGSLNINMAGKALSDGALRQRIKVKNTNSGRIIEGIVRSPEHVEILTASGSGFFEEKPKVSAAVADIRLSNNDR